MQQGEIILEKQLSSVKKGGNVQMRESTERTEIPDKYLRIPFCPYCCFRVTLSLRGKLKNKNVKLEI